MNNDEIASIVFDIHAMLHDIDESVSERFAERMNLFQDDEDLIAESFKNFMMKF